MKKLIIAAAALAVTAPLLIACNGGRDCDSAPAPRDTVPHTSPVGDTGTGEAAFAQVAAPERSSGGRGGGGYRGTIGGSGDDCDD